MSRMCWSKIGTIVLWTLLFFGQWSFTAGSQEQLSHAPELNDTVDFELIADETLELIARGSKELNLKPVYEEVVLVIGLTGAGKTTLSKFITGHPLTSYRTSASYLIKDNEDKISRTSTLLSKTIVPELFTDNETNTVYFDLPGFSDTRNASVELANALFMKMVAERCTKVKILFIVNYSSLRSGESRISLKDLLEHAIRFIKSPKKFFPAIAIIASKVPSYRKVNDIIPEITEFLEKEKRNLGQIFANNSQSASDLIDAFLAGIQGDDESYPRIGYFKQPNRSGLLSQLPGMIEQRRFLQSIVNNTEYVATELDDFGISVSDNARLYVRTIVEKLNLNLELAMEQVSQTLQQHLENQWNNSSLQDIIGGLIVDVENLRAIKNSLEIATTRDEFMEALKEIFIKYPILNPISEQIQLHHKNLEFYEKVDSRSIAPRTLDWVRPITTLVDVLQDRSKNLSLELRSVLMKDQQEICDFVKLKLSKNLEMISADIPFEIKSTNIPFALSSTEMPFKFNYTEEPFAFNFTEVPFKLNSSDILLELDSADKLNSTDAMVKLNNTKNSFEDSNSVNNFYELGPVNSTFELNSDMNVEFKLATTKMFDTKQVTTNLELQNNLHQQLEKDVETLNELVNLLPQESTFNSYLNTSQIYLVTISVLKNISLNYTTNLKLKDNIQFKMVPELQHNMWFRHFDQLLQIFSKVSTFLKQQILEHQHQIKFDLLQANLTLVQEQLLAKRREAETKLEALAKTRNQTIANIQNQENEIARLAADFEARKEGFETNIRMLIDSQSAVEQEIEHFHQNASSMSSEISSLKVSYDRKQEKYRKEVKAMEAQIANLTEQLRILNQIEAPDAVVMKTINFPTVLSNKKTECANRCRTYGEWYNWCVLKFGDDVDWYDKCTPEDGSHDYTGIRFSTRGMPCHSECTTKLSSDHSFMCLTPKYSKLKLFLKTESISNSSPARGDVYGLDHCSPEIGLSVYGNKCIGDCAFVAGHSYKQCQVSTGAIQFCA